MAETILQDWPRDKPWYQRIRRQQSLKIRMLIRRDSVFIRMQRESIRRAFQRLDDFEFYAGTQWRPDQIASMER